jgi:hypothetical protein
VSTPACWRPHVQPVPDHQPLAGELDRLVIGGKESAIGMLAELFVIDPTKNGVCAVTEVVREASV